MSPLTQEFFPIVNTTVLHDPTLVGSLDTQNWEREGATDMEGRLQVLPRFLTALRVGVLTPAWFKDQL